MAMRRRRKAVLLLSVLAIAVAGLLTTKPVRTRYHLWRLEATHNAIWSKPTEVSAGGLAAFGSEKLFEQFDFHRDKLVDLGYLFHAEYDLDQLHGFEDADKVLFRLLSEQNLKRESLPWIEGMNPFEVWDLASNRTKWDTFMAKHNNPSFLADNLDYLDEIRYGGKSATNHAFSPAYPSEPHTPLGIPYSVEKAMMGDAMKGQSFDPRYMSETIQYEGVIEPELPIIEFKELVPSSSPE